VRRHWRPFVAPNVICISKEPEGFPDHDSPKDKPHQDSFLCLFPLFMFCQCGKIYRGPWVSYSSHMITPHVHTPLSRVHQPASQLPGSEDSENSKSTSFEPPSTAKKGVTPEKLKAEDMGAWHVPPTPGRRLGGVTSNHQGNCAKFGDNRCHSSLDDCRFDSRPC
jgi:hypothetical protein